MPKALNPLLPPLDSLPSQQPQARTRRAALLATATVLALALPLLSTVSPPPSTTAINQILAVLLWGCVVLFAAPAMGRQETQPALPLLAALGLLLAGIAASGLWGSLPASQARVAAAVVLATAVVVWAGCAVAAGGLAASARNAFFVAALAAGTLSVVVAVVQVFAPSWADGVWLAAPTSPGRAMGNLRQPNQLSTLLLWSVIALIPLREARRMPRALAWGLLVLFVLGIHLSGSRTGALGVALLAVWGSLDARLGREARALLISSPLIFLGLSLLFTLAPPLGEQAVGIATRAAGGAQVSGRAGIWRDAMALIMANPWTGVGFGGLNFAWTLAPSMGRSGEFFDHVHNLPLQLAVELGLPLAALILALLTWALLRAARRAWARHGVVGAEKRALWVMLTLVLLHSLLEYPLWYAYFLLPTAWLWSLCMGADPGVEGGPMTPRSPTFAQRLILPTAAATLILGALLALQDYRRVSRSFSSSAAGVPLAQRIVDGQRSWLYAHHADYAAATSGTVTDTAALGRATHLLLDGRLLIAWAKSLHDRGELDRASYVAARLREFHPDVAMGLFAACPAQYAPQPSGGLVFPCSVPSPNLTWTDFLPR